jgi:chromate reductase
MSYHHARVSILAVPGSLRKGSYNRTVLQAAVELAPPSAAITIFDGLETVPVFNQDLEDSPQDLSGVLRLRRQLAAADGLLIATPEYNQSIPGVVKNMIDWLTRGEPHEGLAGRPVAVTGATTGSWGTRISQTLLKQMLHSSQALVMPSPTLFISQVESLLDDRGRLVDQQTLTLIGELVSSFVDWIDLVGANRRRVGS